MPTQLRAVNWPRLHPLASEWVATQLGELPNVPARTADEHRHADACASHIQHVGITLSHRAASRVARGENPALVRQELEASLVAAERHLPNDVRLISRWPSASRTIAAAARGFARSRHDAEDLEGAVAEKALNAYRDGLEPAAALDSWLRTVTHNTWVDKCRAIAKHETLLAAARGEGRRVHACNGDRTVESAIARSAARAFAQCLMPHSGDTQAVVRQRTSMRMMLAGAEIAEVATWFHVSEALVRKDISRLRRRVEQEDSLAADLLPPRNPNKAQERLGTPHLIRLAVTAPKGRRLTDIGTIGIVSQNLA